MPANSPRARDQDQISACSWPSVAVAAWRPSGPAATPTSAPRVSLPLTMLSRLRSLRNTITTSADCTPACRPMLPPVRLMNAGADQVPSGVLTDIMPWPRRPPITSPALTVSGITTIARASSRSLLGIALSGIAWISESTRTALRARASSFGPATAVVAKASAALAARASTSASPIGRGRAWNTGIEATPDEQAGIFGPRRAARVQARGVAMNRQ